MKRISSFVLLSFLFVFLFLPASSSSTMRGVRVTAKEGTSLYLYKDYYAMVVGISDYAKWPKLPNAVDDAKEVASKLKEIGFEVKLMLDPTYREIKTALNDMVYEIGREENRAILFYYAGHGETEVLADGTKMGYIIPRDCPILKKDPKGFADFAISMKDIESVSLRIQSKHLLMLFDSCFSGSLFNLVRAAPDDITEKSALPVRQYITAGKQDEQVPDRSIFKRCFLLGLDGDADLTSDGYITGSELGMYLSEKVVNYTSRQQHPQYGKINNPNLDRGDFVFVPLKVQKKAEEAGKKLQEERTAVAEEIKKLREDMKKNEELVEQMKRLVEARAAEGKTNKETSEKRSEEKRTAHIPEKSRSIQDELRVGQGPFKIDDFEDKDLWSIFWNDKWRGFTQDKASVEISADPTQGANGTTSSMKIEYALVQKSAVFINIGGSKSARLSEVERNRSAAYNLSRFNKIIFYLKGSKKNTLLSKPNRIIFLITCYDQDVKSRHGKYVHYFNNAIIRPEKEWQRVEIPFEDFAPSPWTKYNCANYRLKPDLRNVLKMEFVFSSFQEDGGFPDSNTVWIDEITLE